MARCASEELRQECHNSGLDSYGPVRVLRERLSAHIKEFAHPYHQRDTATVRSPTTAQRIAATQGHAAAQRETAGTQLVISPALILTRQGVMYQASSLTFVLVDQPSLSPSAPLENEIQDGCVQGQTCVLVELLRRIPVLSSEEPIEILRFFVRLHDVYQLGLVSDHMFLVRVLPLVGGSMLRFMGDCIRARFSWSECTKRLLKGYFPFFVREKLIRELIVFNFHQRGHSLRAYIDVFTTAEFLEYEAAESDLVDGRVMNFYPEILAHSACTRKNALLCWLIKRAKDVGRLGRWVLRLSPFKFKVTHTRGVENVADALSRVFEGQVSQEPDVSWMALLQSLPLVYSSLADHQDKGPFCIDLRGRITNGLNNDAKFQLHKGLLVYYPRGARRKRFVVPETLRSMLLHYFHNYVLAGDLGAFKPFRKVAANYFGLICAVKFLSMSESASRARGTSRPRLRALVSTVPSFLLGLWKGFSLILWVLWLDPRGVTRPFWLLWTDFLSSSCSILLAR